MSEPEPCPYLSGRQMVMESKVMLDVAAAELEALLVAGWRRFGPYFFRPVCHDCQACVSLRVPVTGFCRSKSQRRAWRRGRDLRIEIGSPRVDDQRLDLHRRWQHWQGGRRGWRSGDLDRESYIMQFCVPCPAPHEFTYYDAGRLVAVSLVDVTPAAVSSIYCFFDPDYQRLSPGTFTALVELDFAARGGQSYFYLGYCVEDCPSLAYKAQFGPHQRLLGRPDAADRAVWRERP